MNDLIVHWKDGIIGKVVKSYINKNNELCITIKITKEYKRREK